MFTVPSLITRIWLTVCQVFTSFIMQSCIAIVAFLGLLSLAIWHKCNEKGSRGSPNQHERHHFGTGRTPEDHTEILITAMVEFQKSQCYFAGAIQIAAIVFAIQQNGPSRQFDINLEVSILPFIICTNGYIPIIFTLTCIGCCGRQSWYLTLLALCCLILSTITFMYSYYLYGLQYPDMERFYGCGRWAPEQLSPWCGPGFSMPTPVNTRIATSSLNYLIWIIPLLWALYCLLKQSLTAEEPQKSSRHSFIAGLASKIAFCDRWIKAGLGEEGKDRAFWAIFLASWSIAFGYQFYAYSLYFRHSQIDPTWSFGQIVAITVWIPATAEYIYLLRCEIFDFFA